jgi:hypothetical protein
VQELVRALVQEPEREPVLVQEPALEQVLVREQALVRELVQAREQVLVQELALVLEQVLVLAREQAPRRDRARAAAITPRPGSWDFGRGRSTSPRTMRGPLRFRTKKS